MTVLYYLEPLITSRLLLLLVLLLLTLKHVRGSFRLKVGQTHGEGELFCSLEKPSPLDFLGLFLSLVSFCFLGYGPLFHPPQSRA